MQLSAQLDHLDVTLLGGVVTQFPDPLSDAEKALVHAYLVLCHAVLEEHLEAAFERHFDRLCGWLISDQVPLECVRFAFAVSQYVPKDQVSYKKRDTVGVIRGLGRKEFSRLLRENHGLKPTNVESLSKLVGVHWTDLEDTLNVELLDLDTLGVKRGSASHLSPYTEKTTALAVTDGPDDVRQWVQNGRLAVEAIVSYLDATIRSQHMKTLIADWDGN
jgi:hypothetical protein